MPQIAGTRTTDAEGVRQAARGGRPALLSRERILDVARQIPARELTMPVVARRLEVSAAALYRHFDSRDALLAALGAELVAQFEIPAPDPARWRDWLLDSCVSLFNFLVDNPVILAAPDWSYVSGMGDRLLQAAYATLDGAGFDALNAMEIWGVVSGHAYLGARLLHDAPMSRDTTMSQTYGGLPPRWRSIVQARGTSDPHEQLVQSLRWLISVLPDPAQTPKRRKPVR